MRCWMLTPTQILARQEADFSKLPFRAVLVVHDSRDWGLDIQIVSELLQAENGTLGTRRVDLGVGKQELEIIFCNRASVRSGCSSSGGLGRGKADVCSPRLPAADLLFGSDYPQSRYGAGGATAALLQCVPPVLSLTPPTLRPAPSAAFKTALQAIHKEATGHDVAITQLGKPHRLTYDFAQAMLERHLRHISGGTRSAVDRTFMVGDNPASDIAGANAYGWQSLLVRTGVYRDEQGPPKHAPSQIVDNVEAGVHWALKKEGLL